MKSGLVPIQRKDFALRIPLQFNFVFEESRDSILAKSSILDVAQTYQVATFDRTSTYGKQKYVYRVRSGDVLGTIAEKYKVGVGDIKKWNNLNGNVIKIGQNLSIWKAPGFQEKALVSSKSVSQPVPGSKIHVVKYGDTLWDISKMYEGLSIEKIKALNNLKTSRIMPGQRLRVG